jgi:hypothetical protein
MYLIKFDKFKGVIYENQNHRKYGAVIVELKEMDGRYDTKEFNDLLPIN